MHPRFLRRLLPLAAILAFSSGIQAAPVAHVIHVSVDALGAKYLTAYLDETPGEFPHFKRLIAEGAATFNARTDYTHTNTLPNHICMITGRPVKSVPEISGMAGHEWTDNRNPAPDGHLHAAGYTASAMDVAHDHGLGTAFYSGKSKFSLFAQSYGAAQGAPDATGEDNGRNKLDHVIVADGIHAKALPDLKARRPAYAFLHYPEPDTAGHKHGYLGVSFREAVKKIDGCLGDLLALVESDAEWAGRTVIIVTADHGGHPGTKSHGTNAEPFNYTIPFIVWGAGVAKGADLYALNPATRTDPGVGRPSYIEPVQPIRNGDSGNLALKLLGLPPIPGSSINHAQNLQVAP